MTDTMDSLTFPHPTLTKIVDEPTPSGIALMRKELYANATAIASSSGGTLGHLAIMMTPAAYLAIPTAVPFHVPAHPGPLPVHAAGATGPQITETNRQHDYATAMFSKYTKVAAALKAQIIAAVGKTYIRAIEDPVLGYSLVSALDLLTHLSTVYGEIKPVDLDKNLETLRAAWPPDNNIEALWERIDTCQQFAQTGNEAIADSTAIRIILTVLEQTGVFGYALDTWRAKPDADKTMVNFRSHFRSENTERIRKATATTSGFHSAHVAAAATTASTASPPPPAHSRAHSTDAVIVDGTERRLYYCWTHGLGPSPAHTSETCTNRGDGHVATATYGNSHGGSTKLTMPRRSNQRRQLGA